MTIFGKKITFTFLKHKKNNLSITNINFNLEATRNEKSITPMMAKPGLTNVDVALVTFVN
jgi:hypothetical protein